MHLPFAERTSPRDIAGATAMSGHFHEVVSGASKVLHGRPLAKEDKDALRWAREVLGIAASTDAVLAMPSAQQLADVGNAAIALRRAARPDGGDPTETLAPLLKGLGNALKGERDEATLSAMTALRDVFSHLSRVLLQAEVIAQNEQGAEKPWALSATTSRS